MPKNQQFVTSKKHPVLWASCVRIFATSLIFIFHFQGLYRLHWDYYLDKCGILLFLFVSGYFCYQIKTPLNTWLLRRFKQILIPYWSVILVVIFLNYCFHYKPTTFAKNIVVFLGGSFFLQDPIYVVSWFITYILILYCCVYILRSIEHRLLQAVFLTVLFLVYHRFDLGNKFYLAGFFLGYFLKWFSIRYSKGEARRKSPVWCKAGGILFEIQNYCYSFYLIHPGILLLTSKIMRLQKFFSLITALLLASALSYLHKKVSDIIIEKISLRKSSIALPT